MFLSTQLPQLAALLSGASLLLSSASGRAFAGQSDGLAVRHRTVGVRLRRLERSVG